MQPDFHVYSCAKNTLIEQLLAIVDMGAEMTGAGLCREFKMPMSPSAWWMEKAIS